MKVAQVARAHQHTSRREEERKRGRGEDARTRSHARDPTSEFTVKKGEGGRVHRLIFRREQKCPMIARATASGPQIFNETFVWPFYL